MAERVLEKGVQIIRVLLEILGREGEERFENVESCEIGRNVGVLEKSVNVFLEFGPVGGVGRDDASGDLPESVGDVFLHVEVSFFVDGLKELDFDEFLGGGTEFGPDVGVS